MTAPQKKPLAQYLWSALRMDHINEIKWRQQPPKLNATMGTVSNKIFENQHIVKKPPSKVTWIGNMMIKKRKEKKPSKYFFIQTI